VIPIVRGDEPEVLSEVRARELPKLARLKEPCSDDITGYQIAAEPLWKAQHYKCCYCEHEIKQHYNDVEHHRPKARADRRPGSTEEHGYWWLAFTWSNLLFACPSCNRSWKNARFPLGDGSVALRLREAPPGKERPLLIDPGGKLNPVEHIEFERRHPKASEPTKSPGRLHWFARPRNRSVQGLFTIHVCGLNDQDLLELRCDHVETCVEQHTTELTDAIKAADDARTRRAFQRALGMLEPRNAYVGLNYDALRTLVPNSVLSPRGLSWPAPRDVGLSAPRRSKGSGSPRR
jgi:hypothetical protein